MCASVPLGGTKNWLVPSLIEDIVSRGFVLIRASAERIWSTGNQRASSNSSLSTSNSSSPVEFKCLYTYNFSLDEIKSILPLTIAVQPIMRLLVGKGQCCDALYWTLRTVRPTSSATSRRMLSSRDSPN